MGVPTRIEQPRRAGHQGQADARGQPQALVDGRVARGARNKRALVEAMLSLIEEGELQPTARDISERAGLALRSVFHHFEDLEGLLSMVAQVQTERHWRLLEPIPSDVPLEDRLQTLLAQRARLFEAITPVRKASRLHEHRSGVLASRLAESRDLLRDQLRATFAPELVGADRAALDALEAVSSWETWVGLRQNRRLSVERTTRTVDWMIKSLLLEATK